MQNMFKKITTFTIAFGAAAVLAACTCGMEPGHKNAKHHHKPAPAAVPQKQEVVMYEMMDVVETEVITDNVVKAKIYTRSSMGGTSDMGYIKFAQTNNGVKMMVDLIDLRPNKDYTVKIYKCGTCSGQNCCSSTCMNAKLPILSIDEPGRLTQTYNVSGIKWQDMNNAKIVLTRDGGYKAAWGKLGPANNF